MSGTMISGVGAVTGYGWGRDQLWQGLTTGKSPADMVARFGADGGEGWVVRVPDGGDERDGASRFSRAMRWAAREAIEDARARDWVPGRRVGLVHAIVLGDLALYEAIGPGAPVQPSVRDYLKLSPSTPISLLMHEYGFRGQAIGVSAMCASSGAALLTAKAWIDADVVDDVVVLATDLSAVPELVTQFVRLGVAITDVEPDVACRPFQPSSRGFTFGEASIGFILSNRTGTPYARLLGGAMTHDAYHLTHIDPDLAGVTDCFTAALDNAGVDARDVAYLNAHGPGTEQCDAAEAAMLERFFPASTGIYSVKPLAGHCQGAAAAVEVAATLLANQHGEIPAPHIADESGGHPQQLDGMTPATDGITVKSSLGMGGHNSVLVLGPGE